MNLRLKCLVAKIFLQVAGIVQCIPPPKKYQDMLLVYREIFTNSYYSCYHYDMNYIYIKVLSLAILRTTLTANQPDASGLLHKITTVLYPALQ